MTSVHLIPTKSPGDGLYAREVNALVAAARGLPMYGVGMSHEIMRANARPLRQNEGWMTVKCSEQVPAYSVFGVTHTLITPFDDEPKCNVVKIAHANRGHMLGLFTNGPAVIPANTPGRARPIGMNEAFRLAITGAQPDPGDFMGVCLGTFTLEATSVDRRYGFVCVGADSTHAWVIRTENGSFVCKTAETITAASGDELGYGDATVCWRENDGETLVLAPKPHAGANDLQFRVYNLGGSVPSNTYVLATGVVGVGLVIERVVGSETKGAFRLAGSVTPVTTSSGANQHMQFIHNDAECYDPIPHATIADTWHGVEIVRTGRHWISAYLEVNIASPTANDGTILMTDGVDLFSKVDNIQGTFALTANDGLGSLGDGSPALDSVIWTAMVFLAMNVHITFPGRMYWLEEGVQLQLYHEYPAAATKASISIAYGFSGFYYGDFGTAWDPDAETP